MSSTPSLAHLGSDIDRLSGAQADDVDLYAHLSGGQADDIDLFADVSGAQADDVDLFADDADVVHASQGELQWLLVNLSTN